MGASSMLDISLQLAQWCTSLPSSGISRDWSKTLESTRSQRERESKRNLANVQELSWTLFETCLHMFMRVYICLHMFTYVYICEYVYFFIYLDNEEKSRDPMRSNEIHARSAERMLSFGRPRHHSCCGSAAAAQSSAASANLSKTSCEKCQISSEFNVFQRVSTCFNVFQRVSTCL